MSTVAFVHEVPDGIWVLDAVEKQLAYLQGRRRDLREKGIADSPNEDTVIRSLERAARIERVALYGTEEMDPLERAQKALHGWEEDQRAVPA